LRYTDSMLPGHIWKCGWQKHFKLSLGFSGVGNYYTPTLASRHARTITALVGFVAYCRNVRCPKVMEETNEITVQTKNLLC